MPELSNDLLIGCISQLRCADYTLRSVKCSMRGNLDGFPSKLCSFMKVGGVRSSVNLWRDFSSSSGIIIRNLGNSTWPFCNSCRTWLYWALDSLSISDSSVFFFFFCCSRWSGANCHYPWWIGWIFYRSSSSPSSEPYQGTIFSGKPAGSIARATWAIYWKQKNSWAISIIAVHTPPPDYPISHNDMMSLIMYLSRLHKSKTSRSEFSSSRKSLLYVTFRHKRSLRWHCNSIKML